MTPLAPVAKLFLIYFLVGSTIAIDIPPGCTFSNGDFECDFRTAVPLNGMDFSPPPQRLAVNQIYGIFNGSNFVEFSTVNLTAFDSNYDATLHLQCSRTSGPSGLLILDNSSFEGMSFYKNVHIRNCEIERLIGSAFHNFVTLNILSFTGGYINKVNTTAFHGLTIESDSTALFPKGELSFDDVDLISGGIGNGVLDPLEDLKILTIKHSRLSVILDDCFKNLHSVHTLNLDDNPLTYMPKEAFRNMTALSKVSLAAVPWQCTCRNLWFVEDFIDDGISFDSEVVCDMPELWTGIRGSNYLLQVCADERCEQGKIPSVDLGGVVCITYLQIMICICATVAFVKVFMITYICIKARRKVNDPNNQGLRLMTPRKPPPRQQAPLSHSKQMTYAKGGGHGYPGDSFA